MSKVVQRRAVAAKPSQVITKQAKSKRMRAAYAAIQPGHEYPLMEALDVTIANSKVKFAATVELVYKLGIDPRHSDQIVRNVVSLPHGTGKTIRVAVIAKGAKQEEAKAAGADLVGEDDLIEQIKQGKIDFDRCIATPDMMGLIGSVARVLGPKGLMPNPKLGTVTMDIAAAVKAAKAGVVEFRAEKAGLVHVPVGKVNFTPVQLAENIKAVTQAIIKAKPSGAKGTYLRQVFICSTMGPALGLTIADLVA
jgi:large subunit ribosomal protein L1